MKEKYLGDISKNILELKFIAYLPIYVKIVNSVNYINSQILKSKLNLGPKMAFYFTEKINNEYFYNITFHAFTVGMNSEIWKQ